MQSHLASRHRASLGLQVSLKVHAGAKKFHARGLGTSLLIGQLGFFFSIPLHEYISWNEFWVSETLSLSDEALYLLKRQV